MEYDGVMMVGIWGVGGGGKTTLASSLYSEISNNFDGSCFIKDVRKNQAKMVWKNCKKEFSNLFWDKNKMET